MKRENTVLTGRILFSRMGKETAWFFMDKSEQASFCFSKEEHRAIAQEIIKNAQQKLKC